jgi:hypothetical protein
MITSTTSCVPKRMFSLTTLPTTTLYDLGKRQEALGIDDEDSFVISVKNMNVADLYKVSCRRSSIIRKSEYRQSIR